MEGRAYPGRVRAVLPVRDERTRTVDALVVVDATLGEALRRGDVARLAVEREVPGRGFWVPRGGLTEGTRGLWALYVVVVEGGRARVERREVELLHVESDRAFVTGPLGDGERIVTAGVHRLAPGMTVRLEAGSEG